MKPNMKRKPIPLYMVDVFNAYQATGRVVCVQPFKGTMSLNGFPPVPYAEAYRKMSALLGVLGVQP
jgi:hypothetical protein